MLIWDWYKCWWRADQSVVCFYAGSFLFLDGGHCFLGGVIQVLRRCDGQAALSQNPLGLVDVGPWQTQEDTVTTGTWIKMTKKTRLNLICHLHWCKNHAVWKTKSSFGGISAHEDRWRELWVNGGKFGCWSGSGLVSEQSLRGKRAICVCVCVCVCMCVCAPPDCSEVRSSRC